MPRKDNPDGGGLSEVSFAEPSEGGKGAERALSNLTSDLRNLDIENPAAYCHIEIKVSSAPTRRFSQKPRPRGFQTNPVLEREHDPTLTICGSGIRGTCTRWLVPTLYEGSYLDHNPCPHVPVALVAWLVRSLLIAATPHGCTQARYWVTVHKT